MYPKQNRVVSAGLRHIRCNWNLCSNYLHSSLHVLATFELHILTQTLSLFFSLFFFFGGGVCCMLWCTETFSRVAGCLMEFSVDVPTNNIIIFPVWCQCYEFVFSKFRLCHTRRANNPTPLQLHSNEKLQTAGSLCLLTTHQSHKSIPCLILWMCVATMHYWTTVDKNLKTICCYDSHIPVTLK